MSFTGQWINSYNSVMTLTQAADGAISGSYTSTTGSSGEYYILGYANPTDGTPALGQSVALAIYWKSYGGGSGDPSWHWVSGLSGQMTLVPCAQPTLVLMHAMVASCDFPGLAVAGTYIDKLVYLPYTGADSAAAQPAVAPVGSGDPVSGAWVCANPSVTLSLQVVPGVPGQLSGSMTISGHLASKVQGFTDIDAVTDKLNLQAVALTAFDSTSGQCVSLAGSVNRTTGQLTLTDLTSSGTAPDSTYLQTTTATWVFLKVN
jgi:hypothetical protein